MWAPAQQQCQIAPQPGRQGVWRWPSAPAPRPLSTARACGAGRPRLLAVATRVRRLLLPAPRHRGMAACVAIVPHGDQLIHRLQRARAAWRWGGGVSVRAQQICSPQAATRGTPTLATAPLPPSVLLAASAHCAPRPSALAAPAADRPCFASASCRPRMALQPLPAPRRPS